MLKFYIFIAFNYSMHRLVSISLILWSVQKYSRILFGLGNGNDSFGRGFYIIVTWQLGTTHYNSAAFSINILRFCFSYMLMMLYYKMDKL